MAYRCNSPALVAKYVENANPVFFRCHIFQRANPYIIWKFFYPCLVHVLSPIWERGNRVAVTIWARQPCCRYADMVGSLPNLYFPLLLPRLLPPFLPPLVHLLC